MMGKCKCLECGRIFNEEDIVRVEEYIGNYGCQRAIQKFAWSPCCESNFDEYYGSDDEDEEEDYDE